MMIQLLNENTVCSCRWGATGHGTVLPSPVPDQSRQVKSLIKDGDIAPDSQNMRASYTKPPSSGQHHAPPIPSPNLQNPIGRAC